MENEYIDYSKISYLLAGFDNEESVRTKDPSDTQGLVVRQLILFFDGMTIRRATELKRQALEVFDNLSLDCIDLVWIAKNPNHKMTLPVAATCLIIDACMRQSVFLVRNIAKIRTWFIERVIEESRKAAEG